MELSLPVEISAAQANPADLAWAEDATDGPKTGPILRQEELLRLYRGSR